MATMDSVTTWSMAAGDADLGLAWRDAATARMVDAGRYVGYEGVVRTAAGDLGLPHDAFERLVDAWRRMKPWPDASAVATLTLPYAFVTNCSAQLALRAARRSGLRPAFTLSAEEAGWYKPRPEIYRLACERVGVEAAGARYVAGAPYDAAGASAAGLSAVLVARRQLPAAVPDRVAVVASLAEAVEEP